MTELEELRAELSALTRERARIIDAAQATIEQANRDYDEQALALHRRIKRLEPPPEPAPPVEVPRETPVTRNRVRGGRTLSLVAVEGWTAEEIALYNRLRARQ